MLKANIPEVGQRLWLLLKLVDGFEIRSNVILVDHFASTGGVFKLPTELFVVWPVKSELILEFELESLY